METEVLLSAPKWQKTHKMPLIGSKEELSAKLVD